MKKSSIKILVADDHSLIIDSLFNLLSDVQYVSRIFTASSKSDMFDVLSREFINIILLDINIHGFNMLDYIDEIRHIRADIKIIILTSYSSQSIINEAIQKKIDAFLHKNTSKEELIHALDQVINGKFYISVGKNRSQIIKDQFELVKDLTSKEFSIIKLLAKGYTNSKISKELFISIHTVQTHRKNIHKKLGVKSVNELIAFAYENKLV